MRNIQRKCIDETLSWGGKGLLISATTLVVLALIGCLPLFLNNFGVLPNNWYDTYRDFTKPIFGISISVFTIFLIILFVFTPFSSSAKDQQDAEDVESPLIDLTSEQQERVIRLLKDMGAPIPGGEKMKRAEITHILHALKELGCIPSDVDNNSLRLWVIRVTGYKEDDKLHFNEAMDRPHKGKSALEIKRRVADLVSGGA